MTKNMDFKVLKEKMGSVLVEHKVSNFFLKQGFPNREKEKLGQRKWSIKLLIYDLKHGF